MKKNERVNLGAVIRVLLALIPIIFGMPTVAMVFCAYIISMYFLTCGPLTFIAGSLCSVVISMFLYGTISETGQLDGLFLAAESILCALSCSVTIMKKKNFFYGVYLAAVAYLSLSFINISQQAHKVGISVAEFLTDAPIKLARIQLEGILENANVGNELINNIINMIKELAVMMIPSVLVIISVVIGYIMMWIISYPFRKTEVFPKHSFAQIRFPRVAAGIIAIAALLWIVAPANLKYICANVVFILCALAFFSGMSLVEFFLKKKIKSFFGRLIIHTVLYMFSLSVAGVSPFINIFTIYTVLAMIDSFVDIRRRTLKGNQKNRREADETQG